MEIRENKFHKYLFLIAITIFCIGITCIRNTPDNDIWARLIAGKYIVENLSVLKTDFLSYTPTHTWFDHEWGASVIFYLVLKYFGASGLIWLKGILTALTILVCFKTVELNKPNSSISYNIIYYILMFIAVYASLGAAVRCLLFTCLFFSVFLYILEKTRRGNKNYLILLPIIMVFWGNIHGGCVSGLGLIVLYCIGEFLNKKPVKQYVVALAACFAALFINPYGIDYVKFLFFAAGMDRYYITEWSSSFHPKYLYSFIQYKIYLIIMIFIQVAYFIKNNVSFQNTDKTKLIIITVTAYLSIMHIRHQSFFIFAAGTLLYNEFYSIFNSIIYFIRKKLRLDNKDFVNIVVSLKEIAIYGLIFLISMPSLLNDNKEIRITETKYPRYAIEFVKINNLKGNLFINFDWGSYAAYKLYPNNLVVMDGRYEEVYNPKLLIELKNFHLLKNNWDKIIKDYKTDVIILEREFPVYNKFLNNKNWKLVFENNLSGVFIPSDKVKGKYILPSTSDEYYNRTLFDTNIDFKKEAD